MGCFADNPEDWVLGGEIMSQSDMTQAVCRTYCEDLDANFYATQVNGGGGCIVEEHCWRDDWWQAAA